MPSRIESQSEPIPGYKLIERLGSGGFGEVWKASAPGGLMKAIKFVFGDIESSGDDGRAAEQELKALDRVKTVRHPFILSLERYDIVDGQLMIVMELADRNLWDRFKECRQQNLQGIPRDELLRYMEESAEALDLMNDEYQLQHLDIKPQNIFLIRNHVKVADFGLVKDFEGQRAAVTGGVTPLYAAPETFDGWLSRFCDQYSLAIVYQELLTGQRPFNGSNSRQLILQHMQAQPNVSSLPHGDREIIARALAKNPNERHPSCGAMVKALLTANSRNHPGNGRAAMLLPPMEPPADLPPEGAGFRTELSMIRNGNLLSTALPQTSQQLDEPFANPKTELRVAAETSNRPLAPVEVQGAGVLTPALVLGLGGVGYGIVQELRRSLLEQFGTLSTLPNFRYLHVDTDPEGAAELFRANSATVGAAAISLGESLVTRLNRPSHYLKPRDGVVSVDSWFNSKTLFRIPRNQVTTGLRPLGRLAFADNFRTIAQRLKVELEACVDPSALTAADRVTKLGVRHNRPRVYIATSLGGGTGAGIFIDVAYLVRDTLRRLGYDRPEVVGIFVLPTIERKATPKGSIALGNAYAALTELNHFSAPETSYAAHFYSKDVPIRDQEPPFARCIMLPMPQVDPDEALDEVVQLGSVYLQHQLVTPIGKTVDLLSGDVRPGRPTLVPCRSIGVYRLAWPRARIIKRASARLALRVLAHWTSKDGKAIRIQVQEWVNQQWVEQQLDPNGLIPKIQAGLVQALGQEPAALVSSMLDPLRAMGPKAENVTAVACAQVLARLDTLLNLPPEGKPAGSLEDEPVESARIPLLLDAVARILGADAKTTLAAMTIGLMDKPAFRLAGAEEAIKHLNHVVNKLIIAQNTMAQSLFAQTVELRAKIVVLIGTLQGFTGWWKRKSTAGADLIAALTEYATVRTQALTVQCSHSIYRMMISGCADHLREAGFARVRLGELNTLLEAAGHTTQTVASIGPGKCLFPQECRDLDHAIEVLSDGISTDEFLSIDEAVQTHVHKQFTSLSTMCVNAAQRFREVAEMIGLQCEDFLDSVLSKSNAAHLFLTQHPSEEDAKGEILSLFDEAIPELSTGRDAGDTEIRVLLTPADESGKVMQNMGQLAIPGLEVVPVPKAMDVIVYREQCGVLLGELPHLGPQACDAYEQMCSMEHFSPHARNDITDWVPLSRS